MNEKYFIPKGSNRRQAEMWLRQKDIDVPDYAPRRLSVMTSAGEFYWCKDRDIPRDVLALGGTGIVGFDVLGELPAQAKGLLDREEIGLIRDNQDRLLQFVLLAERTKIPAIQRAYIARSGQVGIGTSYPTITLATIGKQACVTRVCAGGAEALPRKYSDVDAVYELFQSGESAAINNLIPLSDSNGGYAWQLPVTLAAIKRVQTQGATASRVNPDT